MKSRILVTCFVLCYIWLLVESSPGKTDLTKKDEQLQAQLKRALDGLDEVFRSAENLEELQRRDFWSDALNTVSTFWDENKEEIIKTAVTAVVALVGK